MNVWTWLRTTTEKNRNLTGLLSTPFIMCFSWELGVCTSKLFITLLQHSVVNNIHTPHIISVILEHLFLQGGWQCRVSVMEQMKFSITLNKWRNKAAVCVFVCVCVYAYCGVAPLSKSLEMLRFAAVLERWKLGSEQEKEREARWTYSVMTGIQAEEKQ